MDQLRRIDLNLLLALHALLTERHVTRAAIRLHRSQPAVSHALAQLREHFDDPLLVRQGGKMMLTPRAQALAQPLEHALADLEGLLSTPQFDATQARRCFRLSLSDYAARIILPPLLRHVRRVAPGIDLAVSQASREAMVAQMLDGELDLALGVFPELPQGIIAQSLFDDRFVSVADQQTLPATGELSLSQWLARPHVLVATRPDAFDEIDRTLASQGHRRHIALALPHWSAAVQVLKDTDLILTVARRAVAPLPAHAGVREFIPPVPLDCIDYRQAWHSRKDGDAGHRWLRETVLTCCQPEV
ncbi:LysR family transcriptional regulator [Pseudomonas fulva]|uniref:LysR family transcriptional regulator n=1 Tax=Pseudomonas fulva TaxID=47880 RepID=UPI000D8C5C39|nr:LysR family transcriptional regulator [Pseudomonas fulva]PYB88153.1 LysR family transcriptional regulator [Pseudomonas fulva]PYC12146.1 LysR family transcriptional regulator [Pseudomonas fulva]